MCQGPTASSVWSSEVIIDLADAASPESVGGKAYGLHLLMKWGHTVPAGFVVVAESYRRAVASKAVRSAVAAYEALSPESDAGAQAAALDGIRAALRSAELDRESDSLLEQHWRRMADRAGDGVVVACRSSAIGEDSRTASYAGQHATILGVRDIQSARMAITACWASYWDDQAVAYRRRIGSEASAMAVVVQRVIRADVSGVAFTLNPVTGDRGEVVVNSAYGLGESVVSGRVTPDTFVVSKSDGAVLASEISDSKSSMLVVSDDGGTVERPVDPAAAISSSLSPAQLAEIVARALEVETAAGAPQDVEWAFEDGKLSLLQARPVTERADALS